MLTYANNKFNEMIESKKNNTHSDLFFQTKELMDKINKEFEIYLKIYKQIRKKEIEIDNGIQLLRNELSKLNGQELNDLDVLCKMYSDTNCNWKNRQISKVVEYIILELLYDIDHTDDIKKELTKFELEKKKITIKDAEKKLAYVYDVDEVEILY